MRQTPLLSFVNGTTIAEQHSTPLQRSNAFMTALLEPILSKSPRILDAFLRAISWENPVRPTPRCTRALDPSCFHLCGCCP